MKDLIRALIILSKYTNDTNWPTHCEHDIFMVKAGISKDSVSYSDMEELKSLDFFWSEDKGCFCSYRFGIES